MEGPFERDFEDYESSRVFREEYDNDEEYELEHGEEYRGWKSLKHEFPDDDEYDD